MINEVVETRLERCQAGLPQAVQSSDGAHFRMLLSLISSNQAYEYNASQPVSEGFEIPQTASRLKYPEVDQLYTGEVVGRMSSAFNQGAQGDFAYACSWIDAQANMPVGQNALGDSLARMALQLNGKLMTAEVEQARSALSAHA